MWWTPPHPRCRGPTSGDDALAGGSRTSARTFYLEEIIQQKQTILNCYSEHLIARLVSSSLFARLPHKPANLRFALEFRLELVSRQVGRVFSVLGLANDQLGLKARVATREECFVRRIVASSSNCSFKIGLSSDPGEVCQIKNYSHWPLCGIF